MTHATLQPTADAMYAALKDRDPAFEGVFVVGVRTTGIFCRPTCPARKPRRENVEFFVRLTDALGAGYRPCLRCRPLERAGTPPEWLRGLLAAVEADPGARWRDADLQARGLDPARVRRWFQKEHGMSFHAYQCSRRLGHALRLIQSGADRTATGFAAGFESTSGFRAAFRRWFDTPPGRGRDTRVLQVTRITSPLGPFLAAATADALCLLEFTDRRIDRKSVV